MAEGLLRTAAGERFEVHSAGTVATSVRPEAVRVMAELGIDISNHESKAVGRYLNQSFDWVITVCVTRPKPAPHFLAQRVGCVGRCPIQARSRVMITGASQRLGKCGIGCAS